MPATQLSFPEIECSPVVSRPVLALVAQSSDEGCTGNEKRKGRAATHADSAARKAANVKCESPPGLRDHVATVKTFLLRHARSKVAVELIADGHITYPMQTQPCTPRTRSPSAMSRPRSSVNSGRNQSPFLTVDADREYLCP